MRKPIDISQRYEITLADDEEPKTIFVMRPLTGLEMINLSSFIVNGNLQLTEDNIYTILSKSIVDIKNFDVEGSIDQKIKSLSVNDITELVLKVGEINNITDSDKKK